MSRLQYSGSSSSAITKEMYHSSSSDITRVRSGPSRKELAGFHDTDCLPTLRPGELIEKRYRILSEEGVGGMGIVYLAKDETTGKEVAIKSPIAYGCSSEKSLKYLRREMEALARINHDNVVGFVDLAFSKGVELMVMEYLDGFCLKYPLDLPMPWEEAKPLFIQLCDAVHAVHECGVIHGDIKPNNVLVTFDDGKVKLFDFGLAKFIDAPEGDAERSPQGVFAGSIPFVAPEQIRCEDFDRRADIFALGVTIYETLAGHLPFPGKTSWSQVRAILDASPIPISLFKADIPKKAEDAIMRSLEKKPEDRFQTAAEMKEALLAA